MKTSQKANTGGAQTVDRALQVLKVITSQPGPVLLDDISEQLQLHKSVTYRLVRSLETAQFIGRDVTIGGYSVGTELLSLSVAISSRIDIRRAVRPAMIDIVNLFGETVSLHIRSGNHRVCVDAVEGTHAIRRVIPIGETLPLYAGETGRILLSGLPNSELEQQLVLAEQADIDMVTLRQQIMLAREQRWITGIGVRTPDVGALSVSVRGASGQEAALTISGPATRWDQKAMSLALPKVLEALSRTGKWYPPKG